jgi:FtsP/CotA-like multicopper oxidase with cupredoxin domain
VQGRYCGYGTAGSGRKSMGTAVRGAFSKPRWLAPGGALFYPVTNDTYAQAKRDLLRYRLLHAVSATCDAALADLC